MENARGFLYLIKSSIGGGGEGAPTGRGRGLPRLGRGTGDAAPTFLCLDKEKSPPQRWKRNRFVSKSRPFGQVWTSTGVVRERAAETWGLVPGARYPWGTEIVLPRIWGIGSGFRDGYRI